MFWIVLFLAQAAVPSQIERGEALFFDAQQGCGSCHVLKGKGTAVGPDLTVLGRLGPQAIAMAARSTATQYVEVIKLKSGGGAFPPSPASFPMRRSASESERISRGVQSNTGGNGAGINAL